MKFLSIFISVFLYFSSFSLADDALLESYKSISEVIKRVQAGERKALDELIKIALGSHPLELSDKIKEAVIYGLTTLNRTQELNDFLNKIGMESSDYYSDKKFKTACKLCEGKGHHSSDCKNCVFGKCRNCKGVGKIEYEGFDGEVIESICPTCSGTKKCLTCEGVGDVHTDCTHCAKGKVFDQSRVFSEYVNSVRKIDQLIDKKISQMENVDTKVDSKVSKSSKLAKKMNIDENYKIKQSQNGKEERKPELNQEEEQLEEIADSRLETSFNEVKQLIRNHQNKYNQKICNEIKFVVQDEMPTMVLTLNESFFKNIGDVEKELIHNFEKFWEARTFLNGYRDKVDTQLIINDKDATKLLNLSH